MLKKNILVGPNERHLVLVGTWAIGVCHTGYADCVLARSQHNLHIYCCVHSAGLLMMDTEIVLKSII